MSLLTFLVITIILGALIVLVQGEGDKTVQVLTVLAIAVEVLYLLIAMGALFSSRADTLTKILPCVICVIGLIAIYRMKERSIPLLIFFASLLQFFMEMGIIASIR